jgi:peptidoglycan/xylan/chitin deacetylase (PgdA/CDA1 family)
MLKKEWRFSVDLNDPATLTVTFDDGFVNEAEIACRILQEEGNIPAILFAVGDLIGEKDPMKAPAVDLITHWYALAPNGDYHIPAQGALPDTRFMLTPENRLETWIRVLRPLYVIDSAAKGKCLLAALDALYPLSNIFAKLNSEYLRLRLTGVSESQIAELYSRGWKVGSHSNSHYQLSALGYEEQKRDIFPVREYMKDVVFSYPYGNLDAVSDMTRETVKKAGYIGAVSNMPNGGGLNSKFFLPRFALPDKCDKYRLHFYLSGLETFLRTGKLLPVIRI